MGKINRCIYIFYVNLYLVTEKNVENCFYVERRIKRRNTRRREQLDLLTQGGKRPLHVSALAHLLSSRVKRVFHSVTRGNWK